MKDQLTKGTGNTDRGDQSFLDGILIKNICAEKEKVRGQIGHSASCEQFLREINFPA